MRKIIHEDVPKEVLEKRCQHYKTESIQSGEKISAIQKELGCCKEEITQLRKQLEAMQWRPISEAPRRELVDLILFNGVDVKAGQYWEGYWVDSLSDYIDPQPNHYIPLPPTPEE